MGGSDESYYGKHGALWGAVGRLVRRCLPAVVSHNGVLMVDNATSYDDGRGQLRNVSELLQGARSANAVLEGRQLAMRIFEDYTVSWYWIVIGLVIAMAASLLFIVLLRFVAGAVLGAALLLLVVVLGYGACGAEFRCVGRSCGAALSPHDPAVIILSVVELLVILLLIFLRKRILIAIALIKEAGRAVGHVMSALLFPLCTFFLLCLCIAYWASTALSRSLSHCFQTFSASRPLITERFRSSPITNGSSHFPSITYARFSPITMDFPTPQPITDGVPPLPHDGWTFPPPRRYHTGSLAFGSLILAIVQLIRVILEYLDHRLKGAENKLAKLLLGCLKCCFWCLEKFLKFLNRNAYIMIAVYGTNFCTSARNAFSLLMRNIIRVVVLDKVTDFLLFLGKLLIVGGVGVLAFFFFTHRIKLVEDTAPTLNYYWVPILTVLLGSYLIAHGFLSVFGMCVDTLFLCFCEDLERNDGSPERPYCVPPGLSAVLLRGTPSPSPN
uniref:Choline transporter-like protein n=1 Tax=Pavo cristatus TaxID=9049 RepID=A0A8C9FFX0_PAVCR